MKEHIFEFTIDGSIVIKAGTEDEAKIILEDIIDNKKLLEQSMTFSVKKNYAGVYDENGHIKK